MNVRFVKDLYSLDDKVVTFGLTLNRLYRATGTSQDGVVYILDDCGEPSSLYPGEYEVVEEEVTPL